MEFLAKLIITSLTDLWWVLWKKKRAVKAVQALAEELRFTSGGFGERWEEWEIIECFDGQVEGLFTAIALACRYKEVADTKVKEAALLIKTRTPESLGFHYEIGRPLTGLQKNFTFPDPAFTRETAIKSDNGAMLATVLDSPGIRSIILNLFSQTQHVHLTDYSGWIELHRSEYMNKEEAAAHVRRLARVVRGLYDRAVKAGFLLQRKAA